jgi:hypothetical protein
MSRNLRNLNQPRPVTVTCIDNGRSVKAIVITSKPDLLVVELEGGARLSLYKHATLPGLFVGNQSGLEFQCKPSSN